MNKLPKNHENNPFYNNIILLLILTVNNSVIAKTISPILLNVSSHKVTTLWTEPHYSPKINALCNRNYPANLKKFTICKGLQQWREYSSYLKQALQRNSKIKILSTAANQQINHTRTHVTNYMQMWQLITFLKIKIPTSLPPSWKMLFILWLILCSFSDHSQFLNRQWTKMIKTHIAPTIFWSYYRTLTLLPNSDTQSF